jgi:tRNA modification GTPase
MLAVLEATIDFVDEGDVPQSIRDRISSGADKLTAEMERALTASERGQAIRDGLVVVILGPPNAGKSALMNAIAGREVAIVSARAGTTRDPIEVRVDLDGLPVTFVDTAGIREAQDEIENEGIRRARLRSENADLILWLSEGCDPLPAEFAVRPSMSVRTKIDLSDYVAEGFDHFISTRTGNGVSELLGNIGDSLRELHGGFEPALVTRSRQKTQILRALECVARLRGDDLEPELMSEELRRAVAELDGLVGAIGSEDVLDRIFATFCVGK